MRRRIIESGSTGGGSLVSLLLELIGIIIK